MATVTKLESIECAICKQMMVIKHVDKLPMWGAVLTWLQCHGENHIAEFSEHVLYAYGGKIPSTGTLRYLDRSMIKRLLEAARDQLNDAATRIKYIEAFIAAEAAENRNG